MTDSLVMEGRESCVLPDSLPLPAGAPCSPSPSSLISSASADDDATVSVCSVWDPGISAKRRDIVINI